MGEDESLGEQGEPAFTLAAQGAEEDVAGVGIDIEVSSTGGLPGRDVNADAGIVVSGIGQCGQSVSDREVERRQGVDWAAERSRREPWLGRRGARCEDRIPRRQGHLSVQAALARLRRTRSGARSSRWPAN